MTLPAWNADRVLHDRAGILDRFQKPPSYIHGGLGAIPYNVLNCDPPYIDMLCDANNVNCKCRRVTDCEDGSTHYSAWYACAPPPDCG